MSVLRWSGNDKKTVLKPELHPWPSPQEILYWPHNPKELLNHSDKIAHGQRHNKPQGVFYSDLTIYGECFTVASQSTRCITVISQSTGSVLQWHHNPKEVFYSDITIQGSVLQWHHNSQCFTVTSQSTGTVLRDITIHSTCFTVTSQSTRAVLQ